MNTVKICAVIPTYNHREKLGAIIGALPEGVPAIVVDDGSEPPISLGDIPARLLRLEKNSGKAAALKFAFAEAMRAGFTHAIALDADGQHPAQLAEKFVRAARENPRGIIAGVRNFAGSAAPRARRFMNEFSNFWFRAETGVNLADTQCGFRCYPLGEISKLKMDFGGFVFETELLVKAAWAGIDIVPLPIPALYDADSVSRSHYRPVADTLKFSAMNTKLFFASLLFSRARLKKMSLKK